MNTLAALEHLGFVNGTDFTVSFDGTLTWLSASSQPTEQEIVDAWDQIQIDVSGQEFALKQALCLHDIDTLAEQKRLTYISAGNGQVLVYEKKEQQAQAFKDGGYANPENYPFVQKEAAAVGLTPTEMADLILLRASEWENVGSSIEALRRAAKIAVEAAINTPEIEGIMTQYQTDLDAI
jgi:hypothetical protein